MIPLVSVIIPAHNGEKYLAEAIQSVLDQEYPHYEVWVIDNGSTDRTEGVAKAFLGVQYRAVDTMGVAFARNKGVSLSRGEFLAFLDQDDMWTPEKLTKQVAFLQAHPKFGGVVGKQQMYLEPGCVKPHWLKAEFLQSPQHGYLPSALLVRREAFCGFDTRLALTSDVDWFFKAREKGLSIGVLDEVVVHRRIHEENHSNHCSALQKELLFLIKQSLQRRKTCPK
jgi:glycosyltransferase involved in cell wall biosynthesis